LPSGATVSPYHVYEGDINNSLRLDGHLLRKQKYGWIRLSLRDPPQKTLSMKTLEHSADPLADSSCVLRDNVPISCWNDSSKFHVSNSQTGVL
jgi:hypothetical protein